MSTHTATTSSRVTLDRLGFTSIEEAAALPETWMESYGFEVMGRIATNRGGTACSGGLALAFGVNWKLVQDFFDWADRLCFPFRVIVSGPLSHAARESCLYSNRCASDADEALGRIWQPLSDAGQQLRVIKTLSIDATQVEYPDICITGDPGWITVALGIAYESDRLPEVRAFCDDIFSQLRKAGCPV